MLKSKKKTRQSDGKTKAISEAIKEDTKRLNVILPKSKYENFFLKARKDGSDMSTVVKKWIDEYLDE